MWELLVDSTEWTAEMWESLVDSMVLKLASSREMMMAPMLDLLWEIMWVSL